MHVPGCSFLLLSLSFGTESVVDQYVEMGRQMRILARMMEVVYVDTMKMRNLVMLPNQSLVSKTRR